MDTNMQLTINSFRQLFPDISLIFLVKSDISLTAVKFLDISWFSRQVVTLFMGFRNISIKLSSVLRPYSQIVKV